MTLTKNRLKILMTIQEIIEENKLAHVTPSDIKDRLGKSVRKELGILVIEGYLTKGGWGLYTLTDKGKKAIEGGT